MWMRIRPWRQFMAARTRAAAGAGGEEPAGTGDGSTADASVGEGASGSGPVLRSAARIGTPALARLRGSLWPVLQQTVAATASWWIASHLIDHHQPIFAPITTLIALNANRGERGTNAVRFVIGVIAGIVVAQLAILVVGPGLATFAMATLLAMLVALAVGGERITVAQAAVSAILVVATSGSSQNGVDRLVDVLLGAAVALVFSQLLFPVEPITLLRRAESAALTHLAEALHLTARALRRTDDHLSDWTWEHLRAVYTNLAEVSRARDSTARAARHSPRWWGHASLVAREAEYATRLDLLGNSCLMLTRTAEDLTASPRSTLAPVVGDLASTLDALSIAPGDPVVRRYAAQRAADIATHVPDVGGDARCTTTADAPEGGGGRSDVGRDRELAAACSTTRTVILDVLLFVGTDAEQARRIVHGLTGESPEHSAPPVMPRTPFRSRHRPRKSD